jgi:hypothetical protein
MQNLSLDQDGNSWEKRVKVWLRIRYPNGDFEEVPAGHSGDFGIEGFSRDGRAYQCYASRELLKAADLYENQRRKIKEDIDKFIQNSSDLQRVFGVVKIGSWWFITPEHKSAKLTQYVAEKQQEVLAANLPYVGPNFFIHIATSTDFEAEHQIAVRRGTDNLRIDGVEVGAAQINEWADSNDGLVQKLDAKIQRYAGITDPEKLRELRADWLRLHINGKNVLASLQKSHPQLWEEVDRCKKARRQALFLNYSISKAPPAILEDALDKIRSCISLKIPNIEQVTLDALVQEAVSDWLIECPLDFPNTNANL